ncbi:hypothetical protein B0H11DRAFT_2011976 [Mycena galericulata]|nr:hypothetical protein B0H11DRAFT_2011976 [Mycena galericulata]
MSIAGTLTGAQGFAALSLLAYDIICTLDEEVAVIWIRRWTAMKCLFFFIRYFPLLLQISILFVGTELTPQFHFTFRDCEVWSIYQAAAALLIVLAVDYMLTLRGGSDHLRRRVYVRPKKCFLRRGIIRVRLDTIAPHECRDFY